MAQLSWFLHGRSFHKGGFPGPPDVPRADNQELYNRSTSATNWGKVVAGIAVVHPFFWVSQLTFPQSAAAVLQVTILVILVRQRSCPSGMPEKLEPLF